MNYDEPFGLPRGTVRGVIALAVTGVTLFLFATGASVPEALIAVNGLIVGNYFGSRGPINAPSDVREPVAAPYIPGNDAD